MRIIKRRRTFFWMVINWIISEVNIIKFNGKILIWLFIH
jgi:hypothetical protein